MRVLSQERIIEGLRRTALTLTTGLLLGFPEAGAQSTWSGGTNKYWGNGPNWTPSGVPASGADVSFPGNATRFTVDLGGADRTVGDVSINSATAYTFEDEIGSESLILDNVTISSGFGHSFQHPVVLSGPTSTWDLAGGAYMFVNGVISGSSGLTKDGDGLLTLNNIMTYTGTTTVNDGTLAVAQTKFTALANSPVVVNAAGRFTLDDNGKGDSFFVGSLAGSGITEIDGGHVTFGGDNTSTTYSGSIIDSLGGGSVIKGGTGTWTLSGTLDDDSPVTVSGGTLEIPNGSQDVLADSAVTINSGAQLNIPDTLGATYDLGSLAGAGAADFSAGDIDLGFDNSSTTFSGTMTFDTVEGTGDLTKRGSGTFTLGGSGHNIGKIEIRDGGLTVDGASGSIGRLEVIGSGQVGIIRNTTSALNINSLESSGSLTITGPFTVVEVLGPTNNSQDFVVEDGAVLTVGDVFQQNGFGSFVVDGGYLSFEEFGTSNFGTISLTDPTGGTALTIGGSAADSTFNGIIQDHTSGPGSVTKTGTNSITFSGANTYSGATLIEGGELVVADGNFNAFGNSAVTINSGAQLTIPDTTVAEYRLGSLSGAGPADFGQADIDVGRDNSSTTYSGTLTFDTSEGTAVIEKWGTGTWTLTGSNHNIGKIEVQNGGLVLDGVAGSLGNLDVIGNDETAIIRNTTAAADVSSLTNSGTLTITGNSTLVEISNSISNSEYMVVEDGAVLTIGELFQQSGGNTFVVDEAYVSFEQFGTNNFGTISLTDPTGGTALTIGGSAPSSEFAGIIQDHTSGPGSVTKTGTNSITFSGANTYSGATTIEGGELVISEGNRLALRYSDVTVASGAQLTIPDTTGVSYFLGSLAGAGQVNFGEAELDIGRLDTSTTFSGAFTYDDTLGSGYVTKQGAGSWTLTGSGHQIGNLQVGNGSLTLDGAGGSFGNLWVLGEDQSCTIRNTTSADVFTNIFNTGSLTISGASTVVEPSGLISNAGVNSGSATLTVEGGAQLTLGDQFTQTSSGTLVVDEGHVSLGEFGSNKTGTISLTDPTGGTALTIGTSGSNSTFSGIIHDHTSGPGSVTKTGPGTITFSGANTYSGTTLIEGGELVISEGNFTALGNSAVTIDSGGQLTIPDTTASDYRLGSLSGTGPADFGAGDLDVGRDNSSTTYSGTLTFDTLEGTGDIDKFGNGTWTLSGSGHNIGVIKVQNGGVVLDGVAGTINSLNVFGDGTTGVIRNTTAAAELGSLTNGATLTITGPSTLVSLTNSISNPGSMVVEDGAVLTIGDLFQQSDGGMFVVDEAYVSLKEFAPSNQKFGTIALTDPVGGTALTIGGSAPSSEFAGIIEDHTTGPGSVTKTGSNRIRLTGENTYSGGTTVSGGQLIVNNTSGSGTGSGAVQVASGAQCGGTGSIGGTLTVNSGGTVIPGASDGNGTGTLTLGGLDLEGTYHCDMSGTETDTLAVAGTLTLGGTITFDVGTALSEPVYIIASYGSRSGTFSTVFGLPSGYGISYAHDDGISTNNIALVALTTYDQWAIDNGLTLGVNDGMLDDPNGDGRPNIEHFAFNTDPLGNGSDEGKLRTGFTDDGGNDYFSITVPVRDGAVFTGSPSPTATIDGITYTAQGTGDLTTWDTTVVELIPANSAGLPGLDTGWSYRTFRLDLTQGVLGEGFLRFVLEGE
ncbi:PEP-CTERM domain protein [Haloferula helveola]|uniref:PEP-CTERM domain protein n=1 Tax=Haloferula helveola TaxID=490095 RepID=A0ABM7RCM7_9BACT|nr:PEP-CTERM domain protein [Haloferula helveola]